MSFFADEQVLTKAFLDAWDFTPFNTVPVDLVGLKTDPDEQGRQVRLRIARAPSTPFSIGVSRRNYGSVLVQILCRTGEGNAEILHMADQVAGCFKEADGKPKVIGGLRTKTSSATGVEEENGVMMMTVDIPFVSDHDS